MCRAYSSLWLYGSWYLGLRPRLVCGAPLALRAADGSWRWIGGVWGIFCAEGGWLVMNWEHWWIAMSVDVDRAYRLDGKVALVTGGASGIGAATARELTRAGASVWIADVNLPAAQALAGELTDARAIQMDVTSAASIAAVLDRIDRTGAAGHSGEQCGDWAGGRSGVDQRGGF
jgi:hypothetical protein